mgnify:CR=1 FL=1
MSHLAADIGQASEFIRLLTGAPNSPITFQTFSDQKLRPGANYNALARVLHGRLDEHVDALSVLQRQGAGVFVMINEGDGIPHEGKSTCRTKANVQRVRALFVDLDGAPIDPVVESAVPPDIIVTSSPGRYHAYWVGVECSLADFPIAQKSLAAKWDGDKAVNDTNRVMRLPGFWHQKSEPFMTRLGL